MATPGSSLPGGYVLGRLNHADRVGLVYRAHPGPGAALGARVSANAVVLHPLHVDELREWFEGMAVLGRSLRHPGLVEVFALGYTENDLPVVVTECVEGRTVRNDLLSGRDFSTSGVARIVGSVADALDYLHARPTPVLHRVIMPETVLLADTGDVKLLAVGHADRPHHPAAKAAALSPEELSGDIPLSAASDVFSLASFAYELLTSRAAFPGSTQAFLMSVSRGTLPRVALTHMESATALDAVLHRAWSHDPAQRQPTAGAFAADLSAALGALPAGVLPARRQLRNPAMRTPTLPAPVFSGATTMVSQGPVSGASHGSISHPAVFRASTPASYPPGPRPASNPPPGLVPVAVRAGSAPPQTTPASGSWRPPVGLAPGPATSPWAPPRVPHLALAPTAHVEARPLAPPDLDLSSEAAEITDPEVLAALAKEGLTAPAPSPSTPPAPSAPPPAGPAESQPFLLGGLNPVSTALATPARLKDTVLPPPRDAAELLVRSGGARAVSEATASPPGRDPSGRDTPARGASDRDATRVPLYAREVRLTVPLLAAFVVVNAVITALLVYALAIAGIGRHGAGETPVAAGRCAACAPAGVATTVRAGVALVPR